MPALIRAILTRFWAYLTWKYVIIVCLCVWAMVVQMSFRVPGGIIFWFLPWVGIAISALSFTLLVNQLLRPLPAEDPFRQVLRRIERWAILPVALFLCYSLFLYANGRLDTSAPIDRPSEILRISRGEAYLGWVIPYSWAELRSWENPARTEYVMLRGDEREILWGGEAVRVQLRQGHFGLPWVSGIDRDEERYNRKILEIAPTASVAWKNLITFYFVRHRPKEASALAEAYLKTYPSDFHFITYVGSSLIESAQYAEAEVVLQSVISRRPTYEAYLQLARAVYLQGKKSRSAELLEAAISIDTVNPWAYYHLAYVYKELGRREKAAQMFEKVLQRLPHFPEVEAELASLR